MCCECTEYYQRMDDIWVCGCVGSVIRNRWLEEFMLRRVQVGNKYYTVAETIKDDKDQIVIVSRRTVVFHNGSNTFRPWLIDNIKKIG